MSYPMKQFLSLLSLMLVFTFLTGCSKTLYVSKLAWHQAFISLSSVPVRKVLKDERVDEKTKEKIRLILEVKRYGEEKIGLKKTKSYLKVFNVKGSVLYLLTASEKDQLKLHTLSFPIIGEVTYEGFFSQKDGLKEKERLDERGYDTYLEHSSAYSTLGWLNDPIFSSILKWDEGNLAYIIIHEMTHATVYFKGKTDFNEQMATFVGNQGAIEFLRDKYGSGSQEVLKAVQSQEDDLLFSRWINDAFDQLSTFYSQPISREDKLNGREVIFLSLQEQFKELRPRFKTDAYENFDQISLNNAVVLADRRYLHRLETFDKLYNYFAQDLGKVVALMKEIRASGEDPSAYLDHWMIERGLAISSPLK